MGKGRRNDRGSSDELAPVKAAAWAWYEHGSGSSDRKLNLREFHFTKTQTACRPSRFKVEAMMMMRIKMSTPLKQKRSSENNNASRIDSCEQMNRSGLSPQLARKGSVVAAKAISKKSSEVKELKRLWLWRSRGSVMCGIGKDHHRDVVGNATVFRNNDITATSIKPCVSIQ